MLVDYDRIGVVPIVNAQGNSTPLGGSKLSSGVLAAMTEAAQQHVEIDALWRAAGRTLAQAAGTEDAYPTAGAFAGIAIAVAALVAGTNLTRIQRLPDAGDAPNEVILQKSHAISSSAPIGQMVALGGGRAVEVGSANIAQRAHLIGAITDRTAALLYVTSPDHVTAYSAVSLEDTIAVGREYGIPVIVDAAGEGDLQHWPSTGADLVVFSSQKAFSGPTAGFICGSAALIESCRAQSAGIARCMKIGKETLMGLLQAVAEYASGAFGEGLLLRVETLAERIDAIEGLSARGIPDDRDDRIFRVLVTVDPDIFGLDAVSLNEVLRHGQPAIYLRDFKMQAGQLELDPLPLDADGERVILRRLTELSSRRPLVECDPVE
ncbi:hypothetical protein [Kribbella sp. NPDC051718]|uniref:hypothetical protein n=1 Tax=Kribbella sp. NPDC051718 TaxID=3155168 RepID=UPI00344A87B0